MPALALASIFVNPGDTTSSSNEMPMPMTDDDGPSIASSHPPPPSLTWASVLTTTSSGHLFGSAGCAEASGFTRCAPWQPGPPPPSPLLPITTAYLFPLLADILAAVSAVPSPPTSALGRCTVLYSLSRPSPRVPSQGRGGSSYNLKWALLGTGAPRFWCLLSVSIWYAQLGF